MTNRLRVIIQDNATKRILDYVQLAGLDSQDTLITNMSPMAQNLPGSLNMWDTNAVQWL